MDICGLKGAAKAFFVSKLFKELDRLLLVVCPEEKDAAKFACDLKLFLKNEAVFHYPALDFLTVDMFALQKEEELARLEVFANLQINSNVIMVASSTALRQKVMPIRQFNQYLRIVSTKDLIDRDDLGRRLTECGYKTVSLVEEKGEFSFRGNIIDIFPPTETNPLRLEMLGDEIESIRRFDVITQRSRETVSAFILPPASEVIINSSTLELAVRNVRRRANELSLSREIRDRLVEVLKNNLVSSVNPVFLPLFYESYDNEQGLSTNNLSCVFDYLGRNTLVVLSHPFEIHQAMLAMDQSIDKLLFKNKSSEKFFLEKENTYIDSEDMMSFIKKTVRISLDVWDADRESDAPEPIVLETQPYVCAGELHPGEIKEEAHLRWAVEKIKGWLSEKMRVALCCTTSEALQRMKHLLLSYDVPSQTIPHEQSILDTIGPSETLSHVILLEGEISSGFIFSAMRLVFLGEEEIFVKKTTHRHMRPAHEGYFLKSFGELKESDFVVHKDFGIGIYRGLKKIQVGKIENDFLTIEYADADKLYIPVNALDRIQRYLGAGGHVPKIDKMGGTSWEAVKEKVKRSVREYAEELVAVYAAREIMERKSFSPPDRIYEEFCSTFEFEETPDQIKAIEDIHQDMDDLKPMDRLVCGDAGFGKTEVAIRAAFRAVMDGKQVAVLVPTTILAEQHFQSFSRRFRDFPVRIEVLNRFKNAAEQKKFWRIWLVRRWILSWGRIVFYKKMCNLKIWGWSLLTKNSVSALPIKKN